MQYTGAQRKGDGNTGSTRSPKVVRSGKIGAERSFQTILKTIASDDVELGIMNIRGSVLQGDLVIASGTHILGATTNSGLSGWAAARALITLQEAAYQLHDFSHSNIGSLDQGLSIKLSRVIDALPELPENSEELNARVTMHKIRAVNVEDLHNQRMADETVKKYMTCELYRFEQKSMKWRALALWSFVAVMTLAIMLVVHHP